MNLDPNRECGSCNRSRAEGAVIRPKQSYCNDCQKDYKAKWYQKNKERVYKQLRSKRASAVQAMRR